MKLLFFVRPVLNLLGWLAGKTKWKWDDKGINLLKGLLLDFPDLIPSVVNLVRYGKDTIDEEQEKFKGSKEKKKALKIVYKLVKDAPRKDVERVVKSVKTELKKNTVQGKEYQQETENYIENNYLK